MPYGKTATMPKTNKPASLTREEIGVILRRHRGSIITVADRLGIRGTAMQLWLKGHMTSARIAKAAEQMARELLALEQQEQTAGAPIGPSAGASAADDPEQSAA